MDRDGGSSTRPNRAPRLTALGTRSTTRPYGQKQNFANGGDYVDPEGLTRFDRLNMFRALSAGRRASLYRTTRQIPNGSKR
jgi:hypothetical protein